LKRGTPDHPKVSVLMQVLGCTRQSAIGILELLWHFTARYAPRGDIGRWSDERIAAGLYWTGDPASVVSALTRSGWLDPHPSLRLVVHDWHDHADDTTKKHLKRQRLTFLSKVRRVSGRVQTDPDATGQRPPAVAVPEPQPEPKPVPKPVPVPAAAAAPGIRIPGCEDSTLNKAILDACREIAKLTDKDESEVLKAHSMVPARREGERVRWIVSLDNASEEWRIRTHQDLQAELSRLKAPPSDDETEYGLQSPEQWARTRGQR
jgi:hypothetical protein